MKKLIIAMGMLILTGAACASTLYAGPVALSQDGTAQGAAVLGMSTNTGIGNVYLDTVVANNAQVDGMIGRKVGKFDLLAGLSFLGGYNTVGLVAGANYGHFMLRGSVTPGETGCGGTPGAPVTCTGNTNHSSIWMGYSLDVSN